MMNDEINELVSFSLAVRNNDKMKRDLRKGRNKYTEHYAYYLVIPKVSDKRDEDFALKVSALIATFDFSQDNVTFGEAVRNSKNDNLERRLLSLMNLNRDQAFEEIYRIFNYMENSKTRSNIKLDWYGLARTLSRWGNGVTDNSLKSRQTILRDYYRVEETAPSNNTNEKSE